MWQFWREIIAARQGGRGGSDEDGKIQSQFGEPERKLSTYKSHRTITQKRALRMVLPSLFCCRCVVRCWRFYSTDTTFFSENSRLPAQPEAVFQR